MFVILRIILYCEIINDNILKTCFYSSSMTICVSLVRIVVATFMNLVALTCLKSRAYLIVSIVCLFVCSFLLGTNVIYRFDHL